MIRLALLISGSGTTMRAIIHSCLGGSLSKLVEPAVVISSNSDAGGIEKARALKVPVRVVLRRDYKSAEAFGEEIITLFEDFRVQWFGQYGWLPLTPKGVVERYPGINQHPGPLDPQNRDEVGNPLDFGGKGMYGMAVHTARLYFVRHVPREVSWTEVLSHRVGVKFDDGEILHSERVEITQDDDPETLQQKCLPVEHRVQIETLRRLTLEERFEHHTKRLVYPGEEMILYRSKDVGISLWNPKSL